MSARPKSEYTGRGTKTQVSLTDEEHRELVRQAASYPSLSEYIRFLIAQASKRPVQTPPQKFRPENEDIHWRLEALYNSLDKRDRDNLERMLELFSPRLKSKRAS